MDVTPRHWRYRTLFVAGAASGAADRGRRRAEVFGHADVPLLVVGTELAREGAVDGRNVQPRPAQGAAGPHRGDAAVILLLADKTIQGANVEWANQTSLHPVGLVMIIVLGIATLALPRRHAGVPILIMACFVPSAQRIVIAGLDFSLLRIMVVFGWWRLLARGELAGIRWCRLDTLMLLWCAVGTIVYTLQQASGAALIFKCGASFDAIGLYFLYRGLVRDIGDVDRLARWAALLSVPVALFLLLERSTGRNLFSVFGGVPAITPERFGKLRAQGAFAHAILAGTFWVALLPMMAALWWRDASGRVFAIMGTVATVFIVMACASSTPVAALGAAIVGALAWPLRNSMRLIRWGILGSLVGLHLVMKAPVWHLLGRIDLVGGSTGYHRYRLIDAAVHNFRDWALIGTRSTATWGYYLFDVTNHYILEGVRGGLITLALFVVQIGFAFAAIGHLRAATADRRADEAMTWGMGVSLFVHVVAFVAVSYFGQIIVLWYMLLAMAGSLGGQSIARRAASVGIITSRQLATSMPGACGISK